MITTQDCAVVLNKQDSCKMYRMIQWLVPSFALHILGTDAITIMWYG